MDRTTWESKARAEGTALIDAAVKEGLSDKEEQLARHFFELWIHDMLEGHSEKAVGIISGGCYTFFQGRKITRTVEDVTRGHIDDARWTLKRRPELAADILQEIEDGNLA